MKRLRPMHGEKLGTFMRSGDAPTMQWRRTEVSAMVVDVGVVIGTLFEVQGHLFAPKEGLQCRQLV